MHNKKKSIVGRWACALALFAPPLFAPLYAYDDSSMSPGGPLFTAEVSFMAKVMGEMQSVDAFIDSVVADWESGKPCQVIGFDQNQVQQMITVDENNIQLFYMSDDDGHPLDNPDGQEPSPLKLARVTTEATHRNADDTADIDNVPISLASGLDSSDIKNFNLNGQGDLLYVSPGHSHDFTQSNLAEVTIHATAKSTSPAYYTSYTDDTPTNVITPGLEMYTTDTSDGRYKVTDDHILSAPQDFGVAGSILEGIGWQSDCTFFLKFHDYEDLRQAQKKNGYVHPELEGMIMFLRPSYRSDGGLMKTVNAKTDYTLAQIESFDCFMVHADDYDDGLIAIDEHQTMAFKGVASMNSGTGVFADTVMAYNMMLGSKYLEHCGYTEEITSSGTTGAPYDGQV